MLLAVLLILGLGLASSQTFPSAGDPQNLFPYGPATGDTSLFICDDCSSSPIDLNVNIQLGDSEYNRMWINANGHVTFQGPVVNWRPYSLPMSNTNWKTVAPFWADVDLRVTSVAPDGMIYHRQTTDSDILDRAADEIQAQFPSDFYLFQPSWAYVVTWHKVTYYGAPANGNLLNTFQVVVVTDGAVSFAIFNYGAMCWSLGTASGTTHAVAGFDADDGHHGMISESLTSAMASLSGSRYFWIGGAEEVVHPCHNEQGPQLRLVHGRNGNTMEGYAQFKIDGVWHSICSRGWNDDDATVFCNQLGYPGRAEAKRNEFFGRLSPSLPYAMERVRCSGEETCLTDCTVSMFPDNSHCLDGNEAGVICNGAPEFTRDTRLVGCSTEGQGTVEVLVDGDYVKICDVGWGKEEADVVCQGMGYAAGVPTKNGFFTPTAGLEFGFEKFRCAGTEGSIFSCQHDDDVDNPKCVDGNEAGVICYGSEQEIRLWPNEAGVDVIEGNVEIEIGDNWYKVCDIGFGDNEAQVICSDLLGPNVCFEATAFRGHYFEDEHDHDHDHDDLSFFSFNCDGSEDKLFDCLKPLNGPHCVGGDLAGVRCEIMPQD